MDHEIGEPLLSASKLSGQAKSNLFGLAVLEDQIFRQGQLCTQLFGTTYSTPGWGKAQRQRLILSKHGSFRAFFGWDVSSSRFHVFDRTTEHPQGENGNQIFVNNAEDLKSLATSVSEVLQPDGSIVKEYILNDPKIIEKIRNNIKSESFASRDATAPASKNSNQMIQKSYNLMNRYGDQDQQQIFAKVEYLLLFIIYFGKRADIRVSSSVNFLLDF